MDRSVGYGHDVDAMGGHVVASGTYLVRMRAGDFEKVRKMMLLK